MSKLYFSIFLVNLLSVNYATSKNESDEKLELARTNFGWSKTDLSRISQKIHKLKDIEKEETDELLKHDPKLLEIDPNKVFNDTSSEEDDESFKILNGTRVDIRNATFSGSFNETEYEYDPDYESENGTSGEIQDEDDGLVNLTSNSTNFDSENANFTSSEVDDSSLESNQTDPILEKSPDSSNSSEIFLEKDENEINDGHHEVPNLGKLNKKVQEFLFEGDVAYPEAYIDQLLDEKKSFKTRHRRQAMVPKSGEMAGKRWSKKPNKIAYFFGHKISQQTRQKIIQALNYWEARTCVGFVQNRDGKEPKLKFIKADGCWSYIGQWDAVQPISIGLGCEYIGIIAHEVGHALGFYHSQARWDRDRYVQVLYANIDPEVRSNFQKVSKGQNNNYNQYYDYGSVMHYGRYEFSTSQLNADPKPSIISKRPWHQWTIGQRILPSFLDVKMMNRLYGCGCPKNSVKCQFGGYPNPNNCGWCICPWGFAGQHCGQRQHNGCGRTLQARPSWQTFEKTTSVKGQRWLHQQCHWHINAPKGRRVQVRILNVKGSDNCKDVCFYTHFEVNVGDKWGHYGNTGPRFCCQDQIGNGRTFASLHNKAVVSTYVSFRSLKFKIQYRYIANGAQPQKTPNSKQGIKKRKAKKRTVKNNEVKNKQINENHTIRKKIFKKKNKKISKAHNKLKKKKSKKAKDGSKKSKNHATGKAKNQQKAHNKTKKLQKAKAKNLG